MWSWFGGQSAQAAKDAPKKAILDLRTQLDMLQKREKHLQNQIDQQQNLAKTYAGKNKDLALKALKRKKLQETALKQTEDQMRVLDDQILTIETANLNKETVMAMKNAGAALKTIHGNLTLDSVDDMMEGLREQRDLADEINTAIVTGPTMGDPIDEAELDEELEALEQENLDEKMLKTGTVPVLPTGPSAEPKGKTPVVAEDDEEEELRKLQAEMAMS